MESNEKRGNKSFTLNEIKDKMAKYCLYQDRCHWEVEQKLNGFDLIPEAKEEIITKLYQYGFINEQRFTETFVRGKFNQKNWGRNRLKIELKKRQIPEKMIREALETQIDSEQYFATLQQLAHKKYNLLKAERDSFKKQLKIKNFLAYKGYEYDLIQDVLNDLFRK
ncbi:regulatory protein RecX [Vaginella massiliensis]|uniref:regulatory protein RecX n=1 Tax=Vaginella massiliensis TaxID=1816680 RepID=UPI000838F11A|nr:regulatory protein RecX [Vaginella massiliensis]